MQRIIELERLTFCVWITSSDKNSNWKWRPHWNSFECGNSNAVAGGTERGGGRVAEGFSRQTQYGRANDKFV